MNKKKIALIMICLLFAASCSFFVFKYIFSPEPKTKETDIFLNSADWIVSEIPKIRTQKEDELSRKPNNNILQSGDKLTLTDYVMPSHGYSFLVTKSDDVFFGFDIDENGGGLLQFDWGSLNFRHMEYGYYVEEQGFVIRNSPIRGFYEIDDEYYFLSGNIGMMKIEEGFIGRLFKDDNGKWDCEEYLALPGSPDIWLVEGESLYLVTFEKLLLIADGEVTVLAEDMFWRGLYPSSIVKIDEILYIGMRGGVFAYDLDKHEFKWFERIN